MRRLGKLGPLVPLAVAVAVVAAALSYYQSLLDLPLLSPSGSPRWSRGMLLGEASAYDAPGQTLLADGRVAVMWPGKTKEGPALLFTVVHPQAGAGEPWPLAIQVQAPERPFLLPQGPRVGAVWLDGPPGRKRVMYAQIDPKGQVVLPTRPISPGGKEVWFLHAAARPDGSVVVLWSSGVLANPGMYAVLVGRSGGELVRDLLVDPSGLAPYGQVDRQGRLNAVWIHVEESGGERQVVYALLGADLRVVAGPDAISPYPAQDIVQPRLALDPHFGYVFWEQGVKQAGIETRQVMLVPFSLTRPAQSKAQKLVVTYVAKSHFGAPTAGGTAEPSDYVRFPSVAAGQRDQALVVLACQIPLRRHEPVMLVEATLGPDGLADHRLINDGSGLSAAPSVLAQPEGTTSLVWLQGVGREGHLVWFASTSPVAVAYLNQRTRQDFREAVTWSGLALGASLAFTPVLAFKYALGLALFGVAYLLASEEGHLARHPGLLAAAIVVQVPIDLAIGQAMSLGGLLTGILPDAALAATLAYGLPLASVAAGSLAALIAWKKMGGSSAFLPYLVFAAVGGWLMSFVAFRLLLPGL